MVVYTDWYLKSLVIHENASMYSLSGCCFKIGSISLGLSGLASSSTCNWR